MKHLQETIAERKQRNMKASVSSRRQSKRKKETSHPVKKTAGKLQDSYNKFKEYKGTFYTGAKIGRHQKWYYDQGEWKEQKVTPERWEFNYAVTKRRAGKAPEGSGVPVGTGYHWFILAHQFAEKLNPDDYSTVMTGLKFKLAHKRASKGTWNASDPVQRKNLIRILKDLIAEIESVPEKTTMVPLELEHKGKVYKGMGIPLMSACDGGTCHQLDITLNNEHLGVIRYTKNGWRITGMRQSLVNAIGEKIAAWYGMNGKPA